MEMLAANAMTPVYSHPITRQAIENSEFAEEVGSALSSIKVITDTATMRLITAA